MPVEIKSYREPVEVTFTFPSPSPEEKAAHKTNPRKFPLPPDLQQETGHISVTLRELLPSAEAKAFNRVGRDAGLMIQELVKESLVRAVKVGGEVVELSTEDSSVDAFMAMVGPKGRTLVMAAYNEVNQPKADSNASFLASATAQVR